jgi:hypothetical protein
MKVPEKEANLDRKTDLFFGVDINYDKDKGFEVLKK